MNTQEFTKRIEECFIDGGLTLTPQTRFRDNDQFDSLVGFAMLVYIEEAFGYKMSVDDYLLCHTAEDLYNKIINATK